MEDVQRRSLAWVSLHVLLFLLTLATTTIVGGRFYDSFAAGAEQSLVFFALPKHIFEGLWFSIPLLLILGVHEWGHLEACRRYDIDASLPYFIPAPTLIGTMGAFIRIKSPFYTRRALFDVGIAGPLAGFAVALPVLIAGLAMSKPTPHIFVDGVLNLGFPPLVWLLNRVLNPFGDEFSLLLHPVARAGCIGLFATAMNLLPAGQLDGGHILYSISAKAHRVVSVVVGILLGVPGALILAAIFLQLRYPTLYHLADVTSDFYWMGWFLWAVVILTFGRRHPPTYDYEPLDARRRWLAILALAIFLLCFTPVPFRVSE